jgi:S-(hydroxymethyl)glutathione dehydrogenase/alcohol dehydrogenase
MKAAIYRGDGRPLEIEDVDIDRPGPHEVVVRTAATGVCHSDVHHWEWADNIDVPRILGHEPAGIVEAVGELVTYVQPGDHVIACLSAFCGACEYCLGGHPNLCDKTRTFRRPDEPPRISRGDERIFTLANIGSFAEKMLLHENAVVKIREDIPLDRAALLGCGVITGMGAALRTARVEPNSTVAVFGCGGVGLSAIQGARIAGARQIIAVDTRAEKLELACRLGATHAVDASAGDAVEQVRAVASTPGGVDYSFEAIGIPAVIEQAFLSLRPGGTATVIGIAQDHERITVDPRLLLGERKLQGSSMGSNRFRVDLPNYIDLYLQGRLLLDEMITTRYSLDQVNQSFQDVVDGNVARGVIVFA